MQLTDAQLHDLFEVSRFPRRGTVSAASPDTSTVAQWVDAFKKKRTEIVTRTCRSSKGAEMRKANLT
jgi:hypothetical protein